MGYIHIITIYLVAAVLVMFSLEKEEKKLAYEVPEVPEGFVTWTCPIGQYPAPDMAPGKNGCIINARIVRIN
jgi:hypothetical protein